MMDKSTNVKIQPELQIKTDGELWGFGREGTFDMAGMYNGQYSRDASNSNWFFGRITVKDSTTILFSK